MKAVVVKSFGSIDTFELVEDFEVKPPPQGFVTVQIHASAFNPVDYKIRQGRFGGQVPKEGLILGADFSGVITAVGEGVTIFVVGEEVYGMALGVGQLGGSYAEFTTLSQHLIAKKPSNVSHEQAAAVVITGLTAVKCVQRPNLKSHHSTLITGASGGVGTFLVQLARNVGAKIIATAGSQQSTEYLLQIGVPKENIVNYKGLSLNEIKEKVLAANGGKPFDITYDLFGGEMKKLCFESVELGGHVVTIVEEAPDYSTPLYPSQSPSSLFSNDATFHTIFVGSHSFHPNPSKWSAIHDALRTFTELVEKGTVHTGKVEVVGSLSTDTVKKAHSLLEDHHVAGKLVMKVK